MASIEDRTYYSLRGPAVPSFIVRWVNARGEPCEREFDYEGEAKKFKAAVERIHGGKAALAEKRAQATPRRRDLKGVLRKITGRMTTTSSGSVR